MAVGVAWFSAVGAGMSVLDGAAERPDTSCRADPYGQLPWWQQSASLALLFTLGYAYVSGGVLGRRNPWHSRYGTVFEWVKLVGLAPVLVAAGGMTRSLWAPATLVPYLLGLHYVYTDSWPALQAFGCKWSVPSRWKTFNSLEVALATGILGSVAAFLWTHAHVIYFSGMARILLLGYGATALVLGLHAFFLRASFELHIHHFAFALLVIPLARFPALLLSRAAQGFCLGMLTEAAACWGLDPLLVRRYPSLEDRDADRRWVDEVLPTVDLPTVLWTELLPLVGVSKARTALSAIAANEALRLRGSPTLRSLSLSVLTLPLLLSLSLCLGVPAGNPAAWRSVLHNVRFLTAALESTSPVLFQGRDPQLAPEATEPSAPLELPSAGASATPRSRRRASSSGVEGGLLEGPRRSGKESTAEADLWPLLGRADAVTRDLEALGTDAPAVIGTHPSSWSGPDADVARLVESLRQGWSDDPAVRSVFLEALYLPLLAGGPDLSRQCIAWSPALQSFVAAVRTFDFGSTAREAAPTLGRERPLGGLPLDHTPGCFAFELQGRVREAVARDHAIEASTGEGDFARARIRTRLLLIRWWQLVREQAATDARVAQ